GHRIEPGEIETVLTTHPAVTQATVILREDTPGHPQLVAYAVTQAPVTEDALRDNLRDVLPDYMIPAALLTLDALPLTPHGKLDRDALPAPDYSSRVASRAPEGAREVQLARLFAETLRLDAVGADDGFFHLGGDSIMSIQLIAKARALGLHLTVRDVFEHQTVAELAKITSDTPVVENADQAAHTMPRSGPVPPTPMALWLAELGGPTSEYSQSLTVRTPPGLDADTLAEALQALLRHHDSFRLRADIGGEMEVLPPEAVSVTDCLVTVDATGLDDGALERLLVEEGTAARARLAPARGVMVQAVWLDRGAEDGSLTLVAHHLAVDTVSWHIVLGDLVTACQSVATTPGTAVALQPTGTSWRQWATALHALADAPAREAELDHWRATLADVTPRLRLDPARDTHATTADHVSELDVDTTQALLTWVPDRYNATLNELLLTAFALAVGDWRRRRPDSGGPGAPVVLDLESHGRHEHAVAGVDLTRTTGWFTAVYPLRLQHQAVGRADLGNDGAALSQAVKEIKEQLRRTPGDGLGYGLLRHLNGRTRAQLAGLPGPEFRFNYHGRLVRQRESAHWQPVFSGLSGASPAMPVSHALDLNSVTTEAAEGPRLQARWTYLPRLTTEADAAHLADGWFKALRMLVHHASGQDVMGITPSDVSHTSITQAELDQLEAELDSEWGI
ncbi:non-ribosomal peptide synthase domain TIGR01720, partial [Streptomyces zhaozhouensis]